jgi:hypothetical protein
LAIGVAREALRTLGVALCLAAGAAAAHANDPGSLQNKAIAWHWRLTDQNPRPGHVEDKLNGVTLELTGEAFQILLGDGRTLKASDFVLLDAPRVEAIAPEPGSPTLARRSAGRQWRTRLAAASGDLAADWRVTLREDSDYLRQELTLHATTNDVLVKEIVLFEQPVPHAQTMGTVDGSPVVAGNFFLGYEHPMAQNTVGPSAVVRCGCLRNAVLKQGESLTQSFVLGVVPQGQLRRGFLAYIERERVHPYRPFLHYNTWFDISWDKRKFSEAETLRAIDLFGRELVQKRGVQLRSFLLDDGWDDSRMLWAFHSGFPNGFTEVKRAASKLNASIGVWMSPFGGYDTARMQRLAYGSQHGYETNASGFSLAGPKYYQRFREICQEMVKKYEVNMFKFDGLAAGAKASADGLTRDGDAMLRLVGELRAVAPDIYINQTTGTWPSPFWLLYVDSTYRGGADHDFQGPGTPRQQWLTYRDAQTYRNVVQRGPLYPLNSLMLHGVIFATNAAKLETTSDRDFADEVHTFFGSGTQLQELYLTPTALNQQNWDDLAEAANWSRANAPVLVDTHWVGGDPGTGQVYGWASWSPRKGILVLRNPSDKPATFAADVRALFQLPDGAPRTFIASSPWKKDRAVRPVELTAGEPHNVILQPFEVVVLETRGSAEISTAGH